MASSGPHGHNLGTCPEAIKKNNAELKAEQVFAQVEAIAKEDRGRTPYVSYELDDLPKSADLLGNANADRNTYFDSAIEAEKYRERLLERRTTVDATIPTHPGDVKAHVKALFMAFKSVPMECEDTDKIKKAYSNEGHDNALTEALCWEIVESCIRRSEVSTNLVESYEPEKYKFRKCADKNFEQRFDLLLRGMATSKSLCKHLNDAPFMYKVIDDPLTNVERIESNRKLNGQKAQVMKRGKEAVAEDADEGRNKKRKTEQPKESASVKTESTQRLRPSAASTVAQPSALATTPTRPQQLQHPNSAPANYAMMPQSIMNAPPGHMQYHNPYNPGFFDTPTRNTTAQAMVPQDMLGNGHQSGYNIQAMQAPLPHYGPLPASQFAPIPRPPTSLMRNNPYSRSHIMGNTSRASQYLDPSMMVNQTATAWMPRPEPETRRPSRPSSENNSGASTITAPEFNNADYDNADLDDAGHHTFAFGHDTAAHGAPAHSQAELNALMQQAEQENIESELAEWDAGAV